MLAPVNRRDFLTRLAAGAGGAVVGITVLSAFAQSALAQSAQEQAQDPGRVMVGGVVNMDGEYYKSVRLPPKPNATPQLDDKQIENFEHTIACPCPCTLDVFTCRTTDFSCGNSPAVHRDVMELVKGGYNADEIMQAMVGVYGNKIRMAPPKKGINLIAWFAPFAAVAGGAIVLNAMLRGWRRNSNQATAQTVAANNMRMPDIDATDDEMARLQAVLRGDK